MDQDWNCSTYSEPVTSHALGGLADAAVYEQRAAILKA